MAEKELWYLPSSDQMEPLGPFDTSEIQFKLDQGELSLDSYIYGAHFKEQKWMRLFELETFQSKFSLYPKCPFPKKRAKGLNQQLKTVKLNHSGKGEYGLENEYRRFPRAPMNGEAIIHNQKYFLKGSIKDISEKGLYLIGENKSAEKIFTKGEEVILTVIDSDLDETFSTHGVIINIIEKGNSIGYGFFFLRLNPHVKRSIAEYVIKTLKPSDERAA
jgi:hypothetical protein